MRKTPLNSLSNDGMELLASSFRALGDVSRLKLIRVLYDGEKNVSDLVELTGLSQSNVSRHLGVLVRTGLISRRKEGLNVLYRVIDESLVEICNIVCRKVCVKSRKIV